jgi:hypothetical protein
VPGGGVAVSREELLQSVDASLMETRDGRI